MPPINFLKDIAAMEQSLKRLEEQEQKYSTELDAALNEYAGLREQAQVSTGCSCMKQGRPSARQRTRSGEPGAGGYGEKYNPLLMFDSKKDGFPDAA